MCMCIVVSKICSKTYALILLIHNRIFAGQTLLSSKKSFIWRPYSVPNLIIITNKNKISYIILIEPK